MNVATVLIPYVTVSKGYIIVQCVHDTTIFVHHVSMIMAFRNLLIFLLATPLSSVISIPLFNNYYCQPKNAKGAGQDI